MRARRRPVRGRHRLAVPWWHPPVMAITAAVGMATWWLVPWLAERTS